ncbi:MAG: DUF456 domain-containing protein [Candidatus Nanohaloarchaea archaeon]
MFELFTAAAVLLMLVAVAGSLTPMAPGALFSIAGILVYWYGTGFTRPDAWFLAAFMITGVVAVLTDYLAGTVAAKAGGASTKTSIAAGVVGLILFLALGPIGILVGVAGTVFIRQYLVSRDRDRSLKAATYSVIGVLGSAVVQLTVTVSLLLAFIIALVV